MIQVSKKRVVTNTFLLYGKTFVCLIISLYSTRLVLNALGELDYGIYGTVGGAIAMLSVLNLAMTSATQRFMNYAEGGDDKEHLILIFNNTVLLHIGLGIVIVLLMSIIFNPLFDGVFNIPDDRIIAAKFIYLCLAISTFFSIISVPYEAAINAHEDFLYYSVVGIVVAVLKLIAAIIVAFYIQDRLILYGLLMAVIEVINLMIMRIYCRTKYKECFFSPRRYASKEVAREIGIFSGWNFIGALAQMAGNHGSNILMNHFFGAAIIASKNIGDQISTQVSVLASNMTKALTPAIGKSEGGGNHIQMINLSFKSGRFGVLLYLVLAIPFIYNAEPLLGLWLKKIPDWAVLFCKLQVFRVLMEQLFGALGTMLIAQGTIRQINILNLLLGIITFFVIWGAYSLNFGAKYHYYISIGILVLVSGIAKAFLCRKYCGMSISFFIREVVLRCFLVSVIAIFMCEMSKPLLYDMHVLIVVCIQVCAISLIEFFIGLTKEERQLLFEKARIITRRYV